MKIVSNDFKLNVNSFGRQLDTKIYTWEKAEDGYIPIKGNTTQDGTPTPDNPIDIVNVTGNQEVIITDGTISKSYPISLGTTELCKIGDYQDYIRKSTGINLFDGELETGGIRYQNGVNENVNDRVRTKNFIKVEPNTQYTLKRYSTGNKQLGLRYYDENQNYLGYLNATTNRLINFTTTYNDSGVYYIRWIDLDNDLNALYLLVEGTYTTSNIPDYEPYGKVWYIHKEVGKVVLDGSENGWSKINYTFANNQLYTGRPLSICSHFTNVGTSWVSSDEQYRGKYTTTNSNDQFKCMPLNDMTLTNFKTWLENNNVSVYYVLATATDTIITDTTLIEQLNAIKTLGDTLDRDNIFNINPNFHTNIMETLMKSMIVEVDTPINIGNEIDIYSGIKVGNNYEYINYGKYNVKEFEKDENQKSYKIKCYDDMMLTMVDYDLQVTYPISVKNLLLAICNHFGFTLDTTTFVNDDSLIETDIYSGIGYTFRDVLSELAIATCSTIEIENGIMYIKYPVNTDLVINEDILNDKNVSISKKYGPVNRLVLSRISDSDVELRENTSSISQNGLTELKISDKQIFSTEETRDNMIDEMWNYINGFEYYICDLDTQGLMYVEALDKFNVLIENTLYSTIAFNDETNVSDGLNEEIYNEESELNEDKYKYTKSQNKVIKNAYIEVDKQNARIEAVTTETKTYTDDKTNALKSDLQGQITGVNADLQTYKQTVSTKFTQTTDSFDFRFNNITDLVNVVSDTENEHYEELIKYIRFVNGVIILGEEGNELTAELSNSRLSFKQNGNEVAYISNKKLYITDTEVLNNIIIGNFAFIPRGNGSLSFRKVR